ncbi:MAG TPA: DUF6510 family protein [Mycobacteriales bacterium]|nr:DUF6510 family protein [Mycobacteriales bacterium]
MEFRDGNALAGVLAEVFDVDVTVAVITCDGCGRSGPLAEGRVYDRGLGAVMRCPGCDGILARVVRTPSDLWLDLRGSTSVRIPMAD